MQRIIQGNLGVDEICYVEADKRRVKVVKTCNERAQGEVRQAREFTVLVECWK